jgi:hypothetical protein
MTGNLTLGDNVNAYFGASTDLRIYHDGTNSHIINSTGELRFTGSNFAFKSDSAKLYFGLSDDLQIYHSGANSHINHTGTGGLFIDASGDTYFRNTAGTENRAIFKNDGAVELYHDSSKKFETTSGGVTVTGTLTTSDHIYLPDSKVLYIGAAPALALYHTGTNSHIQNSTGALINTTATFVVNNAANTETMLNAYENGAVTLYHNGSAKLATTSTGIQTTGTLNVNGAYSFPTSDGTNGQVLQTDGSGNLTFVTGGGGAGDITAVVAGTNLTGGATSGSATINLATNLSGLGTITSSGDFTTSGIIKAHRGNSNVAAPNTANHAQGTRISFYDTSATAWYAMGIESSTLWFNSDNAYKWYEDGSLRMSLTGANLNVTGSLASGAITSSGAIVGSTVQATGNLYGTNGLHTLNAAGNGWNHTINRNSGNPTANLPGGISSGDITITGDFPRLYFVDTAGSDLDAYIVNNANGLFFGKTNSPTASNDILGLNLSDKSATFSGNLLLDVDNAEINLKSGVGSTSGAVNWTFNSTGTNYASLKLPYDTRATTGFHLDSGYPITVDATTRINFAISGNTRFRITNTAFEVGTTPIIDLNRNLNNIGTISSGAITSSGNAVFGRTSIDPDSYTNYSGGFGFIQDSGSGWGAYGLFVQGGGLGDAAAIAHNGSSLYFGIQNGSAANSMSTWMVVSPARAVDLTGSTSIALPNTTAGTISSGAITISGNTVWHAGNDGTGSGLDADLLDGIQASSFLRSDANDTSSATYVFNRTSTSPVFDISGHAGASAYNYFMRAANDGGNKAVHFVNGSTRTADHGANAYVIRNDGGKFVLGSSSHPTELVSSGNLTINSNTAWHAGNDGTGSGLDADLLDGQQGSYYLNYDNLYNKPTSIANADTVDGVHAASFLRSDTNDSFTGNSLSFPTLGFSINNNNGAGSYSHYLRGNSTHIVFGTTAGNTFYQNYGNTTGSYNLSGVVTHNAGLVGNKLWGISNDGSGSGLDADTVDGIQAASFLRSDASDTIAVGTTYTFGTSDAEGLRFTNSSYAKSLYIGGWSGANSSGISRIRNSNDNLHLDCGSAGALYLNHYATGVVYIRQNVAWHAGNDGSGSGLDADLLDGYQLNTGRADVANRVVATDSNGYIQAGWINTTSGDDGINIPTRIYASSDGYLRYLDLGSFRSRMNVTAKTGYQGRESNTTDTNYWVGSMGWGAVNMNDMFNYGSGFIDAWGSPANRPPTGTHYTGLQSLHYTASTTYHHGMQMVMSAGNPSYTYLRGWWANGGSGYGWQRIWTDGNDGSGSGLDADTVDGIQGTSFARTDTNNTYSSNLYNYFYVVRGGYSGATNTASLQAYTTGANSAFMSFHRSGQYAVNMGLDADNVLRIGGWSAAANRWVLDMSGNMTAAGNVTAYSDIRLKENIEVIPNALEKVKQIRGVTFTRNDQEDKEVRHTGVIAQEVERVLPEVVSEDNLGVKNVAYGNMVGLLIEAIKELKEEVDDLKSKLENK